MSKTIVPMAGYVLVEDVEANKLPSGVIVAEEEGKQSQIGKVIGVGKINTKLRRGYEISYTEWLNSTKEIKGIDIGDTIIYKKYSGNEVELEGKEYKLVAFQDIIACIK